MHTWYELFKFGMCNKWKSQVINISYTQATSKELHEKDSNDYGKKAAVGYPELVFIAKEFHGNRHLAMEAEQQGQVKRWTGEDGHAWLGYQTSEVGRIEGTCCN